MTQSHGRPTPQVLGSHPWPVCPRQDPLSLRRADLKAWCHATSV